MKAQHCDGKECITWSKNPKEHGFLKITGQGGKSLHFCSWDCVLRFAAKFHPTVQMEMNT